MRIYIRNLRQSKICLAGARSWWKKNNLDWKDFLENGIDEKELLATGDAHARRVVDEAHGRK